MSRRDHMGRSDLYGSLYLQHPTYNYESTGDVESSAGSPMVRVGGTGSTTAIKRW